MHRSTTIPRETWNQSNQNVRYFRHIADVPEIPPNSKDALAKVEERYQFLANDYYLSLINWADPADPIKQLIIPNPEELDDWGKLDACNESSVTVVQGLQHKYPKTALLLCTDACGSCCRYCFRKRLFFDGNNEICRDISQGLDYIASNPDITNVLLTGGDPLLISTQKLAGILEALRDISHVKIVRIGSKLPAFNPWRILDDPELQQTLKKHSTAKQRIYLMAHFDHPRELTDVAIRGIDCFIRSGVTCVNQCPLIRGINDDVEVLAELFQKLSFIGCPPYYVFQGRPTAGNAPYRVPIVKGWNIFNAALSRGSGLAGRARFVMSHETGKLEIQSVDEDRVYLRYHRAKDRAMRGKQLVFKRNDDACWLDELEPA